MSKNAILEVEDLTKKFGGLTAVDSVSMTVDAGEMVGLIGPNGSGKSTLFNCIMHKYQASSGEVYFNGKRITSTPIYQIVNEGISVVSQESNPVKPLTVSQNIKLFLLPNSVWKSRRRVDEQKIRTIAREFDLEDKLETTADSLTHVDTRRLELAKILANDPEFVLIDEPFAGLNKTESDQLSEQISSTKEKYDMTMIIVDHNMNDLLDLVDRVVVLENGRVLARGTPDEIAETKEVQEAYLGGGSRE